MGRGVRAHQGEWPAELNNHEFVLFGVQVAFVVCARV
jgi:hypothetical protein